MWLNAPLQGVPTTASQNDRLWTMSVKSGPARKQNILCAFLLLVCNLSHLAFHLFTWPALSVVKLDRDDEDGW